MFLKKLINVNFFLKLMNLNVIDENVSLIVFLIKFNHSPFDKIAFIIIENSSIIVFFNEIIKI